MKDNYNKEVRELLEKIDNNCRKTRRLRGEIAKMEVLEDTFDQVFEDVDVEDELTLFEEEETDEFEDEISFYLNLYQNLDDDFTMNEILDAIPSRRHYQFIEIVRRLQIESIKEIKEINEIILESGDISKEELEEYKKFIRIEERKINLLNKIISKKSDVVVEEETPNRIILVPTLSGNIRLLEEFNHIPKEFYPSFLELIHSIEDGTFKRVKRFTNHRELIGINEVKGHQVRVVFTRLGSDTYALITAFLKKCDNDKLYKETLCSKVRDYRLVEDKLISSLSDEEFTLQNELYLSEVKRLLGEDKEKVIVK